MTRKSFSGSIFPTRSREERCERYRVWSRFWHIRVGRLHHFTCLRTVLEPHRAKSKSLRRNPAFTLKRDFCRFCLTVEFSPPERRQFFLGCLTAFQVTKCSSHSPSSSESLRRWVTQLFSRQASRSLPRSFPTQLAPHSPCWKLSLDWDWLLALWWVSQFNYRLLLGCYSWNWTFVPYLSVAAFVSCSQ